MSPEQKHLLVERLQDLGYCVGFCGDGANDCGALKAADVGLSLSEAEASVAAPFTSRSTDLVCVIRLIEEGRAALTTSFGSFKFMAVYSLIQFTSVSLLYALASNLADFQFLLIDLALIIPIAVFMSESGPAFGLVPKRPTASLVSKKVLSSMLGQVAIQASMQITIFFWVRTASWYVPTAVDVEKRMFKCHENTVVFLLSCYQYVFVAVAFCAGPPYRESTWSNSKFPIAYTRKG
jgi:cation-transporting ATPase 13A3/4/5